MLTYEVQTLTRMLTLMNCFSPASPSLGVREIARRVGLPSSTVGRLLNALHRAGMLSQNSSTRAYSLGPKVLSWAFTYTATLDVQTKAHPILEELHRTTRESVTLYVLDGCDRVCVDRIESPESMRVVVHVGERMPLYAGASGKTLLAFLSCEERHRILEAVPLVPLTSRTISKRSDLEEELASIRRQGHAVSHGERTAGVVSVAAPVHGADGGVIAALNVTGPAPRISEEQVTRYIRLVMDAAARVSHAMGFMTFHEASIGRQAG